MPARRDLTVEEIRRQAAERQRRFRARRNAMRNATDNVTPIEGEAACSVTPLPSDSPLPSSSTKTTPDAAERLSARVSHYAKRDPKGRVAKAEDFRRLAKAFPALDLEVEVPAAEDWLESAKGQKRLCTYAFLKNWMEGQIEKRKVREALPPAMPPVNGHTWNGVYVQPQALQHNRRPDEPRLLNGDLQPVTPDEWHRALNERRAVPFEQKLAAARNGRQA